NEIKLHAVLVANDGDIVPHGPVSQSKPKHMVKGESAIKITHADADVIDPLDCDGLGHCELRAFADIGYLIWEKVQGVRCNATPLGGNWRTTAGKGSTFSTIGGKSNQPLGKARHSEI